MRVAMISGDHATNTHCLNIPMGPLAVPITARWTPPASVFATTPTGAVAFYFAG